MLNTYTEDSHPVTGCEYGYMASIEALATVFGVRSLRSIDGDDAVYCQCWWRDESNAGAASNQDVCSEMIGGGAVTADPDRLVGCTTGGGMVTGIGDAFVTSTNHCIRLTAGLNTGQSGKGCACPDLNFDGTCDFGLMPPQPCPDVNNDDVCDTFVALGFRNEWNIARFLWDVLDGNNESGQDDTNLTISSLVTSFQAMPCGGGTVGIGVDGDCNEPNPPPEWCYPHQNGDLAGDLMDGTRDAYNPSDFEVLITGSQTAERALNCVAGAN
jgi:hypothetical protein